jgi:hypothetical protein
MSMRIDEFGDFDDIVFWDYEFVAEPGERPKIVCLAWHTLSTGKTQTAWHDELGPERPFRADARVLCVCFVANAELGCDLEEGWPLPVNVLDLSVEFRRITCGRTAPEGRSLLGAMRYYGLDTIGAKQKDAWRNRIMQGWPFTQTEKTGIRKYAGSDVDSMVLLLPRMWPAIGALERALHRGASVAALARMEHRGVPVDREIFPQLADKLAWTHVRDAMTPAIDAAYGVYVRSGPDSDWHFSMELFEAYLEREGIPWPRTEKGKLRTDKKTFERMGKAYAQLEDLRQLRHARNKMRKIKLAVGADFRNRTVLWPFKAKTSRIQPKAALWIFSPATWLRFNIKPDPGRAVAYVDWSSMEFGTAACLSGDPIMMEFYLSGDPYLSFAKRVGALPKTATKQSHGAIRDRYKVGMLAVQYGAQAETLASSVGIPVFEGAEMIAQHRQLFNVYWNWTADWVAHALDTGVMWTPLDWQCRTGISEFNERSIGNFAVQATAADALRIAMIWATQHGLLLLAPVHDAILIESSAEQIEDDVALLREIMRRASRIVLNADPAGTFALRTDATIVRYPARFEDRRGQEMWGRVTTLLADYRRLNAEAV